MADLTTTYMGIPLSSPVIVGACSLSGKVDNIRKAQDAGAGALVIKSLFEEQIRLESQKLDEDRAVGAEHFPEAIQYFPPMEHSGPREHLMWIEKTRAAVQMPLIASLNAIHPSNWVGWAKKLQDTGVQGLELNVYAVQTDLAKTSADVEKVLYDLLQAVLAEVSIPVAVKLSPYYTSVVNVAAELAKRGAKGLVLFNRFLQPEIDLGSESLKNAMSWSRPEEMRLPLRFVALLHGRIQADLAASTGIHTAEAVAKQILAGATVVQVVSALYLNQIAYLGDLNRGLAAWMDQKGYRTLADFRGKLSQKDVKAPFAFERAQYVDLLLKQKV